MSSDAAAVERKDAAFGVSLYDSLVVHGFKIY